MKGKKFGIFVLAVIALTILGYSYISKKGVFNKSNILYAYVDNSTGLTTNSTVQINGFKIGEVRNLNIIDKKIVAELEIDKEIEISQNSQLFSVPTSFLGDNHIEVEFSDQGIEKYKNGDTIKSGILSKDLRQSLDPNGEFEPKLKEISKTIGTALIEYAESPNEKCNANQMAFVLSRLENHPNGLNIKDAFILIENQCKQNAEYSELQNELIFKFLTLNPQPFVRILNHNNFEQRVIDEFLNKVENPISDEFDLQEIINKIIGIEKSEGTDKLIKSLNIAKNKY